jgi:hypothetical protein
MWGREVSFPYQMKVDKKGKLKLYMFRMEEYVFGGIIPIV